MNANVARYIELCDRLKDADEAEYDRLSIELDRMYRDMTAQEIAAVESHYLASDPG